MTAVVERDVGAGLELAEDVGVLGHPVGPRVDVDDRRALALGLLEERRGDRVVGGGVAAGDDRDVGVHHVAVRRGHGPGADALEQGRDAGRVAQPGAVVDVVGVEAGADELLEEVGLLVGALRRAEPGDRGRAALGVDLAQPPGDQVQRLVPGGLPEVRQHLLHRHQASGPAALTAAWRADLLLAADVRGQRPLGVGVVAPDQRHRQPLRRGGVVPAVPALDAQPALRAGLVAALGERDGPALPVHVVRQRAADAAVGADAVDRVELGARPDRDVADRLVGQRAGGAGRDALAAGDAGRGAHRVVQVEGDPGGVPLAAAADDVVALDVVAGPDAAVAEDARVVVDRDDRVGQVDAAAGATGQADRRPAPRSGRPARAAALSPVVVCLGSRSRGGWSASSSSVSTARLRSTSGVDVVTVMPPRRRGRRPRRSARPPTSTTHIRHTPDGVEALVVAQHRDVDAGVAWPRSRSSCPRAP